MRENNWEYARLLCQAAATTTLPTGRGLSVLLGEGLGISWDGSDVPEWRKQLDLVARPAARVVAELGVYYTLSGNGTRSLLPIRARRKGIRDTGTIRPGAASASKTLVRGGFWAACSVAQSAMRWAHRWSS